MHPPSRPGRQLLRLLRADGLLRPRSLGLRMCLAAGERAWSRRCCGVGSSTQPRSGPGAPTPRGARGALCVFVECPAAPRPGATAGVRRAWGAPRSAAPPGLSGKNSASGRPLLPEPSDLGHGRAQPQRAPPASAAGLGGQIIRVAAELVYDRRTGLARSSPCAPGGAPPWFSMERCRCSCSPCSRSGICASAPMPGRWAGSRSMPCWGSRPCAPTAPNGPCSANMRACSSSGPRRAASATRRGQRRRPPGSPGVWPSLPGSWLPIWPTAGRRVGPYC